jgi:hypothetical protein
MAHQRPHFLHVGPERTGTTWLYSMLAQHPDVCLNPVKEIRYFPELDLHPGENLLRRFIGGDWHNIDYRKKLMRRTKFYLKHPPSDRPSFKRLAWDCQYFFGRRSDDWFERLFSSKELKLTGDFTPQTYRISHEQIVRISREWPQTKVMLTLREPVEWMWSIARLWLFAERSHSHVSDDELLRFAAKYPYPTVETLCVWQEAFAGRFQLLYFNELTENAGKFLVKVCQFLDLKTTEVQKLEGIPGKRYSSPPLDISPHFRRLLIHNYEAGVRQLAEQFSSYPRQWLAQYESKASSD